MKLNEAHQLFLDDQSRRSPNTVRAYDLAVRQLVEHLDDPELETKALTAEHVLSAVRRVHIRNVSRNTLASYTTGIFLFARFLVLERLVDFDLTDLERMRERTRAMLGRASRRLPVVPSEDEVSAIIESARKVVGHTPRLRLLAARNLALLQAIRTTGARVSEITGLRCKDLRHGERAALVLGKGDKERFVLFGEDAWADLMAYLELRGETCENGQPLFARHDRAARGELLPLTTNAVRDVLAQAAAEAGVEYVHPHALRHAFATRVLTATGDLAATQDLLGHANPNTTRIYARLAGSHLRAAHDAAGL